MHVLHFLANTCLYLWKALSQCAYAYLRVSGEHELYTPD